MKINPATRVIMHIVGKTGWVFSLTNLKSYPERGIDLRSRDPRRCYNQGYVNC
jgi:hypothetical protein